MQHPFASRIDREERRATVFFYVRKAILQTARNLVARIKAREGLVDKGANVKEAGDGRYPRREISAGIFDESIRF